MAPPFITQTEPYPRLLNLAEAISDSFRCKILSVLAEEREGLTIRQIAAAVGERDRKVRYHLYAMRDQGLVAVAREAQRRGAIERYYRANEPPIITAAESRALPPDKAQSVAVGILRLTLGDAVAAVSAGTFGAGVGHLEARLTGELDERGWRKLHTIFDRAASESRSVMASAAQGHLGPPKRITRVVGGLLLFQAPRPRSGRGAA